MKKLSILAGKSVLWLGDKMHRGSSLPGAVALKLDSHIMEKINSSLNLFFIVILFFGVFTLLVELFSADEFV